MAIEKVKAGQEIKAAKINEVIDEVENIELTPGPKGDAGPKGTTGSKGDPGAGVKAIELTTDEAGAVTGGTATLTDNSTINITIT